MSRMLETAIPISQVVHLVSGYHTQKFPSEKFSTGSTVVLAQRLLLVALST